MALKAGRVGVLPSEVDTNGKIKGGSLSPRVTKLEEQVKTFEFRENEGVGQYRVSSEGEWLDFNGGGDGTYLPITTISEDLPTIITPLYTSYFEYVKCGAVIDSNRLHVDYYFKYVSSTGYSSIFSWNGSRQYKSGILIDIDTNTLYPIATIGGYTTCDIITSLLTIGHTYRLIGVFNS